MRNYILFPNMKKLGIKIRIFTPSFYKISILLRTCVRGFELGTHLTILEFTILLLQLIAEYSNDTQIAFSNSPISSSIFFRL